MCRPAKPVTERLLLIILLHYYTLPHSQLLSLDCMPTLEARVSLVSMSVPNLGHLVHAVEIHKTT
jgi:hypothetical protein